MTNVDRAYLLIDGETIICNTLTEDIDPDVKPINGMTRDNRILGFSQGNPVFRLTAEVAMDADSSIDFVKYALDKTMFDAGIDYEGGGSKSYIDCVVSKATIKSKSGDHITYDLDIIARDYQKN